MPSRGNASPHRTPARGRGARPVPSGRSRSGKPPPTASRRERRPNLRFALTLATVLLAAGAVIAILIRYERTIPPLLADELPNADSVLVEKAERRLSLVRNNRIYRSYAVSLGREPVGHKQREGDLRTPEGHYILDWRNPDSCCYKSLHVSYPDEEDTRLASKRGVDPGGLIMIHGQENGWGWLGWLGPFLYETHGCIAVRNTHMEEIWTAVKDGTPIEIRP